ncbi:MAG TPA: hypothetical protein PKC28_02085 [Bdellovibrionales bacterium]|nr:hypothetical protein [Bdellovibrionales bacterium]
MEKWILFAILFASPAMAQAPGASRVDLDDVSIQGELLNDDRVRLLARGRNSLNDQIKVRSSFKTEILELLPVYYVRPTANTEP